MAKIKYKQKRLPHMDPITFAFLKCIQGQTEKQVAKKAKVHPNTIWRLRHNLTRYPSMKTVVKVFKAYGWEIHFEPKKKVTFKQVWKKIPEVAYAA